MHKFSERRPLPNTQIFIFTPSEAITAFIPPDDHSCFQTVGTSDRHPLDPSYRWTDDEAEYTRVMIEHSEPTVLPRFGSFAEADNYHKPEPSFGANIMAAALQENPKDAVGSKKLPMSVLPWAVLSEAAAGMGEGALKYGKHNYEAVGIRYSIYFDAALRHLIAYHLGEDIDPDSGISHITKAISCLLVLRDAQMYDNCLDDRPVSPPADKLQEAKELYASLIANVEDCGKHYDRESIRRRND